MEKDRLISIINRFKGKNIGVLGDLMLDQFLWGDAKRISPEAPVPVVSIEKENFTPGGAGNTAANIAALGGNAYILGLLGDDAAADLLLREFKRFKINTENVLKVKNKPTTQKIRVIANKQQVIRIDREDCRQIGRAMEQKLEQVVSSKIGAWDVLVISDYAKGIVTENLIKKIIILANKHNKPIVADSKPVHFSYFKNVTILKPNYKEAIEMAKIDDLKKAGKFLQKQLQSNILITQGQDGMTLFEGKEIVHFSAQAKEVFDVAGAGDTVAVGLALSLAAGANLQEASFLANLMAGIVVGKLGVATVSQKELISIL